MDAGKDYEHYSIRIKLLLLQLDYTYWRKQLRIWLIWWLPLFLTKLVSILFMQWLFCYLNMHGGLNGFPICLVRWINNKLKLLSVSLWKSIVKHWAVFFFFFLLFLFLFFLVFFFVFYVFMVFYFLLFSVFFSLNEIFLFNLAC